jgi:hypothetical protein
MQFLVSPDEFSPLIEAIVQKCLSRLEKFDERVAYDEQTAARLLSVPRTSLRDERLRGRVKASRVGRRIRYTRQDLLDYLAKRRWDAC